MENIQNQSEQELSNKYKVMDEISHVIARSGMYIGSKFFEVQNYPLFVPSKNKIVNLANIGYNAGLLKLVDEVLSNSVDEHRRKDSLFRITEIEVEVNSDGFVRIRDNGGIPVISHQELGVLIPKLIFGTLRTSTNYDDTIERDVVGTNGVGAKIANIMSTEFSVFTADGKKQLKVDWKNNMRDIVSEVVEPTVPTNHFTEVTFKIDLSQFDIDELPAQTIRIIQKRCIDGAAANPGLKISFKSNIANGVLDGSFKFDDFIDYVKLYLDEDQVDSMSVYKNKRDIIVLVPDDLTLNVGFVNGALCSEGTHIKKVESQIIEKILELCKKNDMDLFTEKDIRNRISLFVNTNIINPTYDSQSKTKLTTKIDKFVLKISNEFLDSLKDSKLFQDLKDYYEIKYAEQKKKETKKLNGLLRTTKVKKFIQSATNSPSVNELWLFEGDSASSGFRANRNLFQSAYLLRGKIKNTFNLNKNQILENRELREVLTLLSIFFDEGKNNLKTCKYNKIVFATDMDHDGNHICGLLLSFFCKFFPELLKAGKIYRALSPIVIAEKKGKPKEYFYTLDEYHAKEKELKGYDIIYTKGLGGLANEDYKIMLRQQKLIQFELIDITDIESVSIWFDKATEQRKQLILDDGGEEDAA